MNLVNIWSDALSYAPKVVGGKLVINIFPNIKAEIFNAVIYNGDTLFPYNLFFNNNKAVGLLKARTIFSLFRD